MIVHGTHPCEHGAFRSRVNFQVSSLEIQRFRDIGRLRSVRRLTTESFSEMKRLGIDFNLAPVIDLDTNPHNPNIGAMGRSFSADPSERWT